MPPRVCCCLPRLGLDMGGGAGRGGLAGYTGAGALMGDLDIIANRLEQVLQEKSNRLASLLRTTTAIVSSDDLNSVLRVVAVEVAKFISFDRIIVTVIERAKGVYRVLASVSRDGSETAAHRRSDVVFPLAGSIVESVAMGRQALVQRRLSKSADGRPLFPEEDRLVREGMLSYVVIPMVGRDGVEGGLFVARREEEDYSGDDLRFLELIAQQLTGWVQRQRHKEQLWKHHSELAIVNEVSRKAVAQFDMIDLLDSVVSSIQRHFNCYDASIFLVDDSSGDVVLMAHAGVYRELTTVGYRQKIGVGLVGICAASGETIVANDAAREPRRLIAFSGEAAMGSELCVAIKIGNSVMGVINVECEEVGAFDEEDVSALETFAAQIAQTIENARLYEEARLLKDFNESIIANMPAALVVVDADLLIRIVNDTCCRLCGKPRDALVGRDVGELFGAAILRSGNLTEAIRSAIDAGKSVRMPNVKGAISPAVDHLFNVSVAPVGMGTQQCAMVMLEDVTQTVERAYQLSMLRQINEAVQTTLDLRRLLRLVLTCATSGQALGFNRAILLMVDKAANVLRGRLAVGPVNQEDAYRIWQQLSESNKPFKQMLRDVDDGRPDEEMPLYSLAAAMSFPLDSDELVVRVVREKQVAHVPDAYNDGRVSERFRTLLGSNSFACVPLIAKDEAVGAIIVDNLYSGRPITSDQLELLAIFANHVGLAIENAEAYDALHRQIIRLQDAYRELRETQGKLVQSEKLAAIGEVAAHVAHEIRNPLVTIGGFARSIRRQIGEGHPCRPSVDIIIEEVQRLEKILSNVMNFSKPAAPWKRPTKINQIIQNTCMLLSNDFESRNIALTQELAPELPLVMVDGEQIKQALLNILKNAAESITGSGRVHVASRLQDGLVRIDVTDTGRGIPEGMIASIFDPFFTTRPDGTGLGLAVTRKIIVDHGGDIEVRSKIGVGTTFTISLPLTRQW